MAARHHNAKQSITGWLVYSDGIFFQWLEGPRANVEGLMASISADSRHDTVVVLNENEEMRTRLFSGWDMELVSVEEIRPVLLDALATSNNKKSVIALRNLLDELDAKAGVKYVSPRGGLKKSIDL